MPYRQAPDAPAGRRVNRICERRGNGRRTRLPGTSRSMSAIDDVSLDRRRLAHAQHRVIMKIALLHTTATNGNFAVEGCGQSKNDAAFHLCADAIRVDGKSGVNRADDSGNVRTAASDFHVDNLRDDRTEGLVDRNPAPVARRECLSPARFFGCQVEHVPEAGIVVQQVPPVLVRIPTGNDRNLVNE